MTPTWQSDAAYDKSLAKLVARQREIRARELLYEMAIDGLTVEVAGDGRLWVGPKEKLTDQWRSVISEYKTELINELRQ